MSKTRSKQGSDKWGSCYNVSNTIVKQSIEGRLRYCVNGPMGLSLPMSNTRSKKRRYFSNVSKPIEKKALREGQYIVTMGQCESAHLCLRLGII